MPNVTFEHASVTITVRERIGRDELDAPYVHNALVQAIAKALSIDPEDMPEHQWGRIIRFTNALMRSTVDGDLGYPWPSYEAASPDVIYATYEKWLDSPGSLIKAWCQALDAADLEVPDPNE